MRFPPLPSLPIVRNSLVAKALMTIMWTPYGKSLPLCSICGRPTGVYNAHHLKGGMGGKRGRLDLRLIVPVCDASISNCHEKKAHGGETIQWQRLYYVLGNGDMEEGYRIVHEAVSGSGDIPEPSIEEDLWTT